MNDNLNHQRAVIDGLSIHYLTMGSGPALLLLHGCPQTSYAWRYVMPILADHFTLVVPDLPGLGDSAKPETVVDYQKKNVAGLLVNLIQSLGHNTFSVAGHDIGGTVAYPMAVLFPDAVRALVMLDTGPTFDASLLDFTTKVGLWHVPFHMAPAIPEMLVTGRERAYLSQFYNIAYNPRFISEADVDEYVRCYTAPGGLTAYFNYYRALPADNMYLKTLTDAGQKITQPVLVLGGSNGLGQFAEFVMQPYAASVTSAVIAECGHWMPEEQPQAVADQLTRFLKRSA